MSVHTNNRARDHFEVHVRPTMEAWRCAPADLRLAMQAAVALNQMVDHFWHQFSQSDPRRVFGQTSVAAFRKELAKQDEPFALVRDVADAHKHLRLDRTDRALTSAGQTAVSRMGYGEAEFGVGVYGGGDEVVVALDDGRRRHFSAVANHVFTMWERMLA
jgi:hypothetical protein